MNQETSSTASRTGVAGAGLTETFSAVEDVSWGSAQSLNSFSGLLMLFIILQIILVL